MGSPTQRTLELLRRTGHVADVVERRNPHLRFKTHDYIGCIDVIAAGPSGIIAVQTTSGSNLAARRAKVLAEPRAIVWLKAGGRIFLHGWSKRKVKRGGKAVRWHCNEEEVLLSDFPSCAGCRRSGESTHCMGTVEHPL